MRILLLILILVFIPLVAGAGDIGSALPKAGAPGYSHDFTGDEAGVYLLGNSLAGIAYNFDVGATLELDFLDCPTRNWTSNCVTIATFTAADGSGTYSPKKQFLLIWVHTPGTGTLVVKGGYRVVTNVATTQSSTPPPVGGSSLWGTMVWGMDVWGS